MRDCRLAIGDCKTLNLSGTRRSAEAPQPLRCEGHPGASSAGATPFPIPNTAVKPRSGDDTPSGESSLVRIDQKDSYKESFWRLGILWLMAKLIQRNTGRDGYIERLLGTFHRDL